MDIVGENCSFLSVMFFKSGEWINHICQHIYKFEMTLLNNGTCHKLLK